ncbi:hypothetical protein R5R35_004724 [Gryllus longicercus]|uniref:Vacuolar protein sorting-associated protein 53 homolog n=1 Tax=Gryllus longicercus TaxID=2509291 RepID=A0AAN9VEH1_9ORTH
MKTFEDDELEEEGSHAFINFPPEVQSAIEQVLPSNDPLDQPDFDAVDYINSQFPTEQSLSNIDDVIANMECKIRSIDSEIRSVVRSQTNKGQDGRAALEEAQRVIQQLFVHVRDIKAKAEQSEEVVKEITRDIKQLDCAKRNLTAAITTLNHLHMLAGGVDTLQALTERRQYGEVALPLQAVLEVLRHFQGHLQVPQVRKLADQVQQVQATLERQILADFHEAFGGGGGGGGPGSGGGGGGPAGPKHGGAAPSKQLADACRVLSVLDPRVRRELFKWFVGLQLAEYKHLFQASQDTAWLDKVDRRYAWLKRHLLTFEEKLGPLFPPHWEMSERIAVEFCHVTRAELSALMRQRREEIDVKLLLFAIQRSANLEALLGRRFTGITLREAATAPIPAATTSSPPTNPAADATDASTPTTAITSSAPQSQPQAPAADAPPSTQPPPSPFQGLIGRCFEPYLYIYIESLDRNLSELIDRFVQDAKQQQSAASSGAPGGNGDGALPGEGGGAVLSSCADLFVFYKKCMVQCTQLSTGEPMLGLAATFQRYLREYANKLLLGSLPKLRRVSPPGPAGASAGLSTTVSLFNSFMKEDEVLRFTPEEQARVCSVLTTAEYCLETTQQLEQKLKEKVQPELADRISLSQEQDVFHNVISSCIQLLVQDLEAACEPALAVMSKISWETTETVGDQSGYVTAVTAHLKQTVPVVRENLASSRKYFTQFCVKFANSFIPSLLKQLSKCRNVSTVGAEQLLLDTHMLKTALLELPSLGCSVSRKAPASYTKVVVQGMARAEMLLKVVMVPSEPAAAFLEQFCKLLPDATEAELRKLLEMKGMKSHEYKNILDLYRNHQQAAGTSIPLPLVTSPEHETRGIKKLEKYIKKRL